MSLELDQLLNEKPRKDKIPYGDPNTPGLATLFLVDTIN